MRLFLLLLSTFALPALAQDPGVQRELMQPLQPSLKGDIEPIEAPR